MIDSRAQHTTLLTRRGDLIRIPNSSMLNSVVIVGVQTEMEVEVEVDLADPAALEQVRGRLKEELNSRSVDLDLVRVAAAMAGNGDGQKLTCKLRVRAPEPVDPAQLARALAVAGASQP